MKLNRREFLRATGLTGLLAAFGFELPEAVKKPPAVVPSTGRMEIQYNITEQGVGGWTTQPPLQVHKFQDTIISVEITYDDKWPGPSIPKHVRGLLAEHYAKATDAEILGTT